MSDPTRRLCELVKEYTITGVLDIDTLRECVSAGADVMYTAESRTEGLVLHKLAIDGHTEGFLTCLETARDINFTLVSNVGPSKGQTVLQYLAGKSCSECVEGRVSMIKGIVDHIQRHPNDCVDWECRTRSGVDFINLVAQNHLLRHLYPVIRVMPYYQDQESPIPLSEVWRFDYEALDETEKEELDISGAVIFESSEITALLWRLCEASEWCPSDTATFQKYVDSGADVMFIGPGEESFPLLSILLLFNAIECVLIGLRTPRALDFTLEGKVKVTFLHCLAGLDGTVCPLTSFIAVLHAVIDHLTTHAGRDKVDWGKQSWLEHECISVAAMRGRLSDWWGVVKSREVDYYVHHMGPIVLNGGVEEEDWEKIPPEDKQRFLLSST